ncbi:MAG: Type 1 glutamine amidotransferase-like domain-containing protein [Acidobacteria bacterium]|nr:Type 1 glutamine amidotransferase-like domain-containing protein [Acidobacteriota bacterium]
MKPVPGDIYLIAGDPGQRGVGRDPLLAAILGQLGLERPSVAYVGAASGDSRLFFLWAASVLKKAGSGPVRLAALASRRPDVDKVRRTLQASDLVFVSGGDVDAGMSVLQRTGADRSLRELHRAGKPFVGLSAGSIMMARSWVRWPDAGDDATAEEFPCLGLAPLLCDTHAEKEDWDELKALLRLSGAREGYGIPAGAALRVPGAGPLAAMGRPVQRLRMEHGLARLAGELEPD